MDIPAFDALDRTRRLQEAVLTHDRTPLEAWVSDRMIWTLPSADNRRGKREWIEASCSVAWEWFDVQVLRELDLSTNRLVESWIGQRYPKDGEVIEAAGVVVDLWTVENGEWRLIARHPQRADA